MERRNPFSPPVAQPYAGCAKCTELADRRAAFRQEHDLSKVTDINVLLDRHQSSEHGEVNT